MKILIINPNSTEAITEAILETAKKYANKDTHITAKTVVKAPPSIECYYDEAITIPELIKIIMDNQDKYDGFIIACHSDPGINIAREISKKPVIGIGQASMLYATVLGHKFSILSIKDKAVPKKEDLVEFYGLTKKCASIRATGLGVNDISKGQKTYDLLEEAGRKAIDEDGAEVLILGCAGMAGLDKYLEGQLGVPVVDGVVCAVKMMEGILAYNLTINRKGKYQPIREYKGF